MSESFMEQNEIDKQLYPQEYEYDFIPIFSHIRTYIRLKSKYILIRII